MREAEKRNEERAERRAQIELEFEKELEGTDGMRQVTTRSGESSMIPDNDV